MKVVKKILKVFCIIIVVIITLLIINDIRIILSYNINKYEIAQNIYGYTDYYVPQAITYSEKYNVILETAYNKKHKVSKLYVIDFDSGNLIKELKLIKPDNTENTKHVGGITTNDKLVWITSDYEIEEYILEDIINTSDDYIKSIKLDKLYNRGDYCLYKDNTLLVGDFLLNPFYKVPDNNPLLLAYDIDNLDYNSPIYAISMPKMVQGVTITPSGNYVTTESFTYLNNSRMKTYKLIDNNETIKINNKDIKYYKFNKKSLVSARNIPPMAEGLFYKDNYVYVLFESSSNAYSLAYPKINKLIKFKTK